jgi:phosphoribosylformimino-5-aminoimidazole carboxamide ribotide isomerase
MAPLLALAPAKSRRGSLTLTRPCANSSRRMYAAAGMPGGHVIMLGKGNEEAALSALRAYPGGLQVGGGVTAENARAYLDAGASHVIVTSYVFRDGAIDYERLALLVAAVGRERLVLDLSCRRRARPADDAGGGGGGGGGEGGGGSGYFVVTDRWQRFTQVEVTRESLVALSAHCAEFLVHGVDVEGMRVGIMEDLVEKLGAWSPIPVTYAGGARCMADLERVRELGRGRVDLTIGSALDIFGGDVPWVDVVAWQARQES